MTSAGTISTWPSPTSTIWTNGPRFTDMRWLDVRVGTNGDFNQQSAAGSILGRFYGPGHVEVGGTFEHIEAIGAFGAKRQ